MAGAASVYHFGCLHWLFSVASWPAWIFLMMGSWRTAPRISGLYRSTQKLDLRFQRMPYIASIGTREMWKMTVLGRSAARNPASFFQRIRSSLEPNSLQVDHFPANRYRHQIGDAPLRVVSERSQGACSWVRVSA